MGGSIVMCAQCEVQGAQHTALWQTNANTDGQGGACVCGRRESSKHQLYPILFRNSTLIRNSFSSSWALFNHLFFCSGTIVDLCCYCHQHFQSVMVYTGAIFPAILLMSSRCLYWVNSTTTLQELYGKKSSTGVTLQNKIVMRKLRCSESLKLVSKEKFITWSFSTWLLPSKTLNEVPNQWCSFSTFVASDIIDHMTFSKQVKLRHRASQTF